jgi:hypothetical protein
VNLGQLLRRVQLQHRALGWQASLAEVTWPGSSSGVRQHPGIFSQEMTAWSQTDCELSLRAKCSNRRRASRAAQALPKAAVFPAETAAKAIANAVRDQRHPSTEHGMFSGALIYISTCLRD